MGHHSDSHGSNALGSYHVIPTQDHSDELGHVSPYNVYLYTFIALLFFTFITVAVTRFDFGTWNVVLALGIASVKAGLVALLFMHLKFERMTTWLYALFPLVLLGILIGGLFIDGPLREVNEPVAVLGAPVAAPAPLPAAGAH